MKGLFSIIFFLSINYKVFSKDIDCPFFIKDSLPKILTFEQLKPLLSTKSDSVFVINFWATWCAPCVAELPYFEKLSTEFSDKKVKIILVSLDFKSQFQSKLLPFIQKNRIKSEICLLSEKDSNVWIPKVNEQWSGSIPATLIFDKKNRQFYEQSFDSYKDLKKTIKPFLDSNY